MKFDGTWGKRASLSLGTGTLAPGLYSALARRGFNRPHGGIRFQLHRHLEINHSA